jgi:integrase
MNGGRSLRNPKARVWDVVEDWFAREVIPNKSYKTADTYRYTCEAYLQPIADKSIGTISPVTLELILERMADEGRSTAVRHKTKTVMGSFFRWAKKQGYVLFNPAADLPEIEQVPVRDIDGAVLTMREMLIVADCADAYGGYYKTHTRALAMTGMRFGELAAVGKDACHFHEHGKPPHIHINYSYTARAKELRPPKNGKPRHVYIPQQLAEEIEQMIATQEVSGIAHPDGFVFTTHGGSMLNDANYRTRVFQPAYEAAVKQGLIEAKASRPFPHVLRHGVVTSLQENDASRDTAGKHVGHSSNAVTARYTHETDDARLKALKVLEQVVQEATNQSESAEE